MEILSFLVFLIYTLIILMVLIYVSPLLSALVLVFLPVLAIYLLPEWTMEFFSQIQFSIVVPVYNIHILLLIWSAFIGIVTYVEISSWYLLREPEPKNRKNRLLTGCQRRYQRMHQKPDRPRSRIL
ncbi:hypothetical protein [Candidatus Methanoperedens nitratireducens]|uniref:Uncharacterized protein n=1 Tax=Candidatus Methanoperedens nitratireducens TaxID=1392998 RepID=A0A284VJ75_9EURY|nr:hypothetical protein [Candidatus Methanoperedens nitroreducens]SNQ59310.1 conserved membrane hypothetical protein [Candidatus Methanoperedens nitroreducens]